MESTVKMNNKRYRCIFNLYRFIRWTSSISSHMLRKIKNCSQATLKCIPLDQDLTVVSVDLIWFFSSLPKLFAKAPRSNRARSVRCLFSFRYAIDNKVNKYSRLKAFFIFVYPFCGTNRVLSDWLNSSLFIWLFDKTLCCACINWLRAPYTEPKLYFHFTVVRRQSLRDNRRQFRVSHFPTDGIKWVNEITNFVGSFFFAPFYTHFCVIEHVYRVFISFRIVYSECLTV